MATLATEEKKLETTPVQPVQDTGNELNANLETGSKPKAVELGDTAIKSMYDRTMETLKASQDSMPVFTSDYDSNIRELYQKITNREGFKYDYSTDPVYGQYKESYIQTGRQAMRDTMGQTAALTGGYGNSYGSVAGQQVYDEHLRGLNDIIPELEGRAYDRYAAEGDRLNLLYTLAGDMRDTQFDEFRTAVGDWQYEKAAEVEEAYNRASLGDFSAYEKLYGKEAAKIAQIMTNPQAAWASGVATADEILAYTGAYPIGYEDPNAMVYGGGGGYMTAGDNFRESRINTVRAAMRDSSDKQAVVDSAVNNGLITPAEGLSVMKNWG